MKETRPNIVIIGGGTGGTLAANLAAKHLPQANVFLVSESQYHLFQPSFLEIAFKGTNPQKIQKNEESLTDKRVQLVISRASNIDLKQQTVRLDNGTSLSYDYLIIATGSVPNPDVIPGLRGGSLNFHTGPGEARKVWDAIEQFEKGHIVVGIAGLPHKCPPSPNEAVFLLDDYLRKNGKRDKVKITYITPYPRAYPAEPLSKIVTPLFEKRGIELVTFFNVDTIDPVKKEMYSLEGESVSYDLLIMVPPHRGADVVIKSGIGDADGWIPADKYTMKINGTTNAYAIGDATNIPVSKSGVTAHLEAQIAVNNIISSIKDLGKTHRYNGRINCPFEMGSGKASFVVASYDMTAKSIQPSRIRYWMKNMFKKIYWRTLSGNWDWLLHLYFGKTETITEKN